MNYKTKFVLLMFLALIALPGYTQQPPFKLPKKSKLTKIRSAVIVTSKGTLYLELYPDDAPWHVANFKYLADKGFYNGLKFKIFKPGYIIQGGGPRNNPSGDVGWRLPAEFNDRPHEYGSLGMARKQDLINPERSSNSSQFHILLRRASHMDGSYTVFGKVVAGYETLEKLRADDRIEMLTVYVRNPESKSSTIEALIP
ncbi:MAG: peptidylprolyl isomerase [Bdellovibrionota bacterium]